MREKVCDANEIPGEGESRMFLVGERMIGVFHVDGRLFALANECPHAGASLAHGDLEGDTIRCRIHHWGFCVRDGRYLDADEPRWNAQSYVVHLTDDELHVEVPSS